MSIIDEPGAHERNPIWLARKWADCLDIPSGDFVKEDLRFISVEIEKRDAEIVGLRADIRNEQDATHRMMLSDAARIKQQDAEIARLSAARRPFSDALAEQTIDSQVREIDRLRAVVVEERAASARLTDLLALAKAAGGATSRRRRRLMRIEKFDGDKAYVAVNAKYREARAAIARLTAENERMAAELGAARSFNVNNEVWVRLTDEGRRQLNRNREGSALPHGKFPGLPVEDADGFSKWQLWDLMSQFGPHMFNGCEIPFETEIYLSEPTAALAKLSATKGA